MSLGTKYRKEKGGRTLPLSPITWGSRRWPPLSLPASPLLGVAAAGTPCSFPSRPLLPSLPTAGGRRRGEGSEKGRGGAKPLLPPPPSRTAAAPARCRCLLPPLLLVHRPLPLLAPATAAAMPWMGRRRAREEEEGGRALRVSLPLLCFAQRQIGKGPNENGKEKNGKKRKMAGAKTQMANVKLCKTP
ncbi:hypothetical protein Taro_052665 [Colocasia esculenta]|uniref:Uncharacterized protein n=1 Tax=Colocasia esculenta TaxID=4460 RepID=A0A843XJZ7_COLES|nr:hypothetical protein [Colocasia esculenta]